MQHSVTQEQSIVPETLGEQDVTNFWLAPRFGNMECLHACFVKHEYGPHTHDTYAVGIVERGVELYRNRGCNVIFQAGMATALNPGDLHDGRPAEGGFEYRMIYPSHALMCRVAADVTDGRIDIPYFNNSLMDDPQLVLRFARLHRLLAEPLDSLAVESALYETLGHLIRVHADDHPADLRIGDEGQLMFRVSQYIREHLEEDPDLADLAHLAGMSRYRLIRSFAKETGQTPHAYLVNRRVERAKEMLVGGAALAETAAACGFYDQSHLNRTFKRAAGVTPGEFRRACNNIQ